MPHKFSHKLKSICENETCCKKYISYKSIVSKALERNMWIFLKENLFLCLRLRYYLHIEKSRKTLTSNFIQYWKIMLIVIYKKTCFCVVEVAFEERESSYMHLNCNKSINRREGGRVGGGVLLSFGDGGVNKRSPYHQKNL